MIDLQNLTPEQEAEVEDVFKNALKLAGEMSHLMEKKHPAVQSGAVVFVLAAIVISDLDNKRFKNADESIAHYVEGVHSVLQDMMNAQKRNEDIVQ
jgi:hypothetical protein